MAENTLNNIPAVIQLSATALEEYEDYQELFSVLSEVHQQGKSIFEIDSLQKEILYAVAVKEENRANAWARNLLLAKDTLSYLEPVILPSYLKSSAVIPIPAQKPSMENKLIVYPNPASGYFIVKYELDNNYAEAFINITDMTGKNTKSYLIDMVRDYLVIPTSGLVSGNYLVKLVINNREVGIQKLVIR